MHYNTNEGKLKLPEYGRLVQRMAEYVVTIQDRAARQAYAERLAFIMERMIPKGQRAQDVAHKIWDHLAYLTSYQLDIDFPVEIRRFEPSMQPQRLSYPQGRIRYRHYGRLVERAIAKLRDMPAGTVRDQTLLLVANRMKRNLASWKSDNATDDKVAHDLSSYTDGQLTI